MALQDPTPPLRVVRTLADHARDIRALSTESATGPLRASVALVAILNDWPRWQHEAGGMTGEAWCAKVMLLRGLECIASGYAAEAAVHRTWAGEG